ncbi:MAG: hypothetical protein LH603_11180 [Pseudonocardia sp.]|nr:hypothetical protein [Pseudonocardia sp.]
MLPTDHPDIATDRPRAGAQPAVASPDDASVIARSLHDPPWFAQLYDRHAAPVRGYLARRVGADLADDLVAQTFLVAFDKRTTFDLSRPDARPWLFGIATALVRRHRRDEIRGYRALARAGGSAERRARGQRSRSPHGCRDLRERSQDRHRERARRTARHMIHS